MQYVAVKFRATDLRTYTYVNNGAPVKVGDFVKVADRRGGWSRVEVTAIVDKPQFECKPILGLADGAAVDEKLLAVPDPAPHTPDLFG